MECPVCEGIIKHERSKPLHEKSHRHRKAVADKYGLDVRLHIAATCVCGRTFNRKEGLQRHLKNGKCKHGIRPSSEHSRVDSSARRDSAHGPPAKRLRHANHIPDDTWAQLLQPAPLAATTTQMDSTTTNTGLNNNSSRLSGHGGMSIGSEKIDSSLEGRSPLDVAFSSRSVNEIDNRVGNTPTSAVANNGGTHINNLLSDELHEFTASLHPTTNAVAHQQIATSQERISRRSFDLSSDSYLPDVRVEEIIRQALPNINSDDLFVSHESLPQLDTALGLASDLPQDEHSLDADYDELPNDASLFVTAEFASLGTASLADLESVALDETLYWENAALQWEKDFNAALYPTSATTMEGMSTVISSDVEKSTSCVAKIIPTLDTASAISMGMASDAQVRADSATTGDGEGQLQSQSQALRAKIDARLASDAKPRRRSLLAVGASKLHQTVKIPRCPICEKVLPLDDGAIQRHFAKHTTLNRGHLCVDCGILFTARDLSWHNASVEKHGSCGFEHIHPSAECSGHHPPLEGPLGASPLSDNYRLQMWCMIPWRTARYEVDRARVYRALIEEISPERRPISESWSISKCMRRPFSQLSEHSLASSFGALSISQRSEPDALQRSPSQKLDLKSLRARFRGKPRQPALLSIAESAEHAHQADLAAQLLFACCFNDEVNVLRCLVAGADVDLLAGEGVESSLIAAAGRGHESIVRLLLEADATLDLQTPDHGTALAAAILHQRERIVDLLIAQGARLERIMGDRSAHDIAIAYGYMDIARQISELGMARGATRTSFTRPNPSSSSSSRWHSKLTAIALRIQPVA